MSTKYEFEVFSFDEVLKNSFDSLKVSCMWRVEVLGYGGYCIGDVRACHGR